MEETINIKDLLNVLKKRMTLIVLCVAIAAMVAGVVSFFVLTPIFQSSTQLLVNQKKSAGDVYQYNEVQTNVQLINTYNEIIKSPVILDKVIKELDLNTTMDQLNGQITVEAKQNSQVFTVSVQDKNPKMARDIANTIAIVFQKEIGNIMSVDNVSILAKAELADHPAPIKPNPKLNIAIAVVVGLMVGVGLAFLIEFIDNTIKTEKDIEDLLGISVLGVITEMDAPKRANSLQRVGLKGEVKNA
ncbi:YveK family protein [Gottfriedia acidiceleris]|uniref:YveK family protein n=1 Tax=Gottfriedia acidiceleris TaxID=371036 RepID=UPI003D1B96BC